MIPYESSIVAEFFPSGKTVRMVVTLDPMHDEEFTKMANGRLHEPTLESLTSGSGASSRNAVSIPTASHWRLDLSSVIFGRQRVAVHRRAAVFNSVGGLNLIEGPGNWPKVVGTQQKRLVTIGSGEPFVFQVGATRRR